MSSPYSASSSSPNSTTKRTNNNNHITKNHQDVDILKSTISDLVGQLDSAQKRMQQVFSQSTNVVSQLAEREKQMSKKVHQQHKRLKEIMMMNTKNSKNKNENEGDDNDDSSSSTVVEPNPYERIRLNVGGRIFESTRKVLTRFPDSVFSLLLSGDFPLERDESTNAIFLDRDPDVFAHILRYLRTGMVPAGFLSELDVDRAMLEGGDANEAAEVEEYFNFLHFREQQQQTINNNPKNKVENTEDQSGSQQNNNYNAMMTASSSSSSTFVGGARAAAEIKKKTRRGGENDYENNNNSNNDDENPTIVPTATAAGTVTAAAPSSSSSWSEYSLAQRHFLLEQEARYFMLEDLLLRLSRNRMRWFACIQKARPTPRCFATMQIIGYYGYVFGGCSATDRFFDDLYRVCLHPVSAASYNSNNNVDGNSDENDDHHGDSSFLREQQQSSSAGAAGVAMLRRNSSSGGLSKNTRGRKKRRRSSNADDENQVSSEDENEENISDEDEGNNNINNTTSSMTTMDSATLPYYKGPFEWEKVVTKKGRVPDPRSGHTMNSCATVSNFHHDNNNSGTAESNDSTSSEQQQQEQQQPHNHHHHEYREDGGLLVLFGNDRSRMLSNVIVFDVDESAWRDVIQVVKAPQGVGSRGNNNNINNNNNSQNQSPYGRGAGTHNLPPSRSGHSFTKISSTPYKNANGKHLERFVLIGGKQIFPDTTHYNDIFFAEYDPFTLTLSWSPADVIVNNNGIGATDIINSNNNQNPSSDDHQLNTTDLHHFGGGGATMESRSYHSAVYREQDDQVYIFGGIINNVYSNELCTFCPSTCVWRTISSSCPSLPSYVPPAARSGHVAFIIDNGQRMLVAGSYSEETEELTVGLLTFATMKWTTAKIDPRLGSHLETPSRRAAVSGGLLPALAGGGGSRLPMLVLFGGFELSQRKCFNDLFVLPL